jgi:uncharacterized membrane protein YedE/YeeE
MGSIAMSHFTPVSALIGGLLIGLSASLLLWFNGRIAGVSNVLGGLLSRRAGEHVWRALFLTGLVVGAADYGVLSGAATNLRHDFPIPLLILAGLLTGFGTARANGCTSGHGVCGLARLSLRSGVATATFLGVALITTYVVRHILGVAT